MSNCLMLLCANIFLLWFMLGWIPLGFWRTILSVVVGSMSGGIVGEFFIDGSAGSEEVCGRLICCPPFAVRQQEGRMEVGSSGKCFCFECFPER